MLKLKNILYPEGETPIEMILGPQGVKIYEEVKEMLKQKAEPVMMDYLKGMNVKEKLQEVKTPELLERVEVVFITVAFKELVCDLLDEYKPSAGMLNYYLTIEQKVWLFDKFIASFHHGAATYVTPFFSERAEQLRTGKNGRIITLN